VIFGLKILPLRNDQLIMWLRCMPQKAETTLFICGWFLQTSISI